MGNMPAASSVPPRTFWQRRVRDPLVAQLTQGITPHKLALTLAVGSALALFPLLGTTTALCFVAAATLRLNQPIIQLLNQALWPVHLPAIYFCIRFGELLFGIDHPPGNLHHMSVLLWTKPGQFFHDFGALTLHTVAAWALLAPAFIVVVYFSSLPLMRGIARAKARSASPPGQPSDV